MNKKGKTISTLSSIAKQAGVSKATVSRVLNNVGAAAPETRERIFNIARQMNYVPDAKFKQLSLLKTPEKSARTGNLGLLLPATDAKNFSSHPYYGRLFWAIENAASKQGRHLVVASPEDDSSDYMLKMITDQKVDGVLIANTVDAALVRHIAQALPTVLINSMTDEPGVPALMPDESSGVKKALDYLRALGHTKITFFDIADSSPPNINHAMRAKAFRELTARAKHAKTVVLPAREKSLEETLFDVLQTWQRAGAMPTALLCAADTYAAAFLEAAARLGISVPGALSVIGADDTLPCLYTRPKLTSIRQPLEQMGAAGVRTLVDKIESEETGASKVTMLFDVELVVRDSCAPPCHA